LAGKGFLSIESNCRKPLNFLVHEKLQFQFELNRHETTDDAVYEKGNFRLRPFEEVGDNVTIMLLR